MSKTEMTILGLLNERPMYGYEFKQTVRDRWMNIWAMISIPTIYHNLNRLTQEGYIAEDRKEKIGKNPQRNVFSITENGIKRLSELVKDGIHSCDHHGILFWLSIAFVQHIDKETALSGLYNKLKHLGDAIVELEGHKNLAVKTHKGVPLQWEVLALSGLDHMKVEWKYVNKLIENIDILMEKHKKA